MFDNKWSNSYLSTGCCWSNRHVVNAGHRYGTATMWAVLLLVLRKKAMNDVQAANWGVRRSRHYASQLPNASMSRDMIPCRQWSFLCTHGKLFLDLYWGMYFNPPNGNIIQYFTSVSWCAQCFVTTPNSNALPREKLKHQRIGWCRVGVHRWQTCLAPCPTDS